MVDPASFDSLSLVALRIIAWSSIAVAAAFVLMLLAAAACAAVDYLMDKRAARRRCISREAAAQRLEIGDAAATEPPPTPLEVALSNVEREPPTQPWSTIMRTSTITVAAALLMALGTVPALAQSGHDLFQQALVKERADGDLRGAIELYERIVQEFSADRTLAATALVQMGECYEKLGSTEAERAYRRVLQDFADQAELVQQARTRLAALARRAEGPPVADEGSGIMVRQVDWGEACGSPSADGRYLSYCDWETGDVGLYDITTGESRRLTTDASWIPPMQFTIAARTSPDGKQVAHSWFHGDSGTGIRVVGVDGGSPHTLLKPGTAGVELYPRAWSWDGHRIAGARYGRPGERCGIVWVSLDDGSVRPLKRFDEPFWLTLSPSPDDQYLAFDYPVEGDTGKYDIAMVATDGSGEVPLVKHPANDKLLGWLPGSEEVLFISDRSGTWDAWALRMKRGTPQGQPWPFWRNMGQVRPMGFTSHGSLFYAITTRRFTTNVAPFDPVTDEIRVEDAEPLLGSFRSPDWSPDGEYLAYESEEQSPAGAGHYRGTPLHVRHLATGEERVLAEHLGIRTPRWAPDGASILLVGYDRFDKSERYTGAIYRVDVETGEATAVVKFSEDVANWWGGFSGIWSADGQSIIYARSRTDPWSSGVQEGKLRVRDLESGQERVLYSDPNIEAKLLALSPDGQWVAFVLADSAGAELLLAHLADDRIHELATLGLPEPRAIEWAPDGGQILVARNRDKGSEFLRVAVESGEVEHFSVMGERIEGFAIHPAGDRIAYATYVQEDQIWVMENLRAALEGQE
jgi:Tol biopolymer transport system component